MKRNGREPIFRRQGNINHWIHSWKLEIKFFKGMIKQTNWRSSLSNKRGNVTLNRREDYLAKSV